MDLDKKIDKKNLQNFHVKFQTHSSNSSGSFEGRSVSPLLPFADRLAQTDSPS